MPEIKYQNDVLKGGAQSLYVFVTWCTKVSTCKN